MMNLIELQPGEGIYVGADGVHAWLDGRKRDRISHLKINPALIFLQYSLTTEIIELMATSDNVLNLGFVPAAEKDSVDLFIDAVTCEPKSGEEYKLSKQKWNLGSGAGATIYKVRHSALQKAVTSSGAEAD
jgi:mannose-6-phosphate isomerase